MNRNHPRRVAAANRITERLSHPPAQIAAAKQLIEAFGWGGKMTPQEMIEGTRWEPWPERIDE